MHHASVDPALILSSAIPHLPFHMTLHRFNAVFALTAVFFTGSAHGALLARWTADNYVSGANCTDVAAVVPIVANQRNSPLAVPHASGSHKGIDVSGGKYFTVLAARNPLGGKSSFTLAAVFRPASPGSAGFNWYQASGLIGMEQGPALRDGPARPSPSLTALSCRRLFIGFR